MIGLPLTAVARRETGREHDLGTRMPFGQQEFGNTRNLPCPEDF